MAEAERDARDDVFFWSSQMRKTERVGWELEFPLLACAYEPALCRLGDTLPALLRSGSERRPHGVLSTKRSLGSMLLERVTIG